MNSTCGEEFTRVIIAFETFLTTNYNSERKSVLACRVYISKREGEKQSFSKLKTPQKGVLFFSNVKFIMLHTRQKLGGAGFSGSFRFIRRSFIDTASLFKI